ncbi:MAG: sensor histidine kinase [Acidimicrobiia bacterium]|nr:sensor histidine kinase [Acidimicrobiia bacterium]
MDRIRTLRRRLPERAVDAALAAGVLAAEFVTGVVALDDQCRVCDFTAARVVTILLMSLPLYWRRRHPIPVFVVVGLAATYNGVIDAPALNLGILVAVYSVAAYASLAWSLGALAVTVGAIVVIHLDRGGLGPEFRLDLTAFLPVWLLGRLSAAHLRHIDDLEARAELADRDREQRTALAAAEERRRIARELHDIVAHGMSVMVVHAENASDTVESEPALARRSLDVIAETGRGSIEELRRVLGVLRDADRPELLPQPTLADVATLVERFDAAGLTVHLDDTVDADVPASVGASAHHIVREALTNVIRHAGASTARVSLGTDDDRLTVIVSDDGRGPAGDRGDRGHGLRGIRERAEALGGSADFTPPPGGGFRVAATLPLDPGP